MFSGGVILPFRSLCATALLFAAPILSAQVIVAPSSLTGRQLSRSTISLSWQDNSQDETAFGIQMRSGNSGYVNIAIVEANTTSTNINFPLELNPTSSRIFLPAGINHQFRVAALRGPFNSDFTDAFSIIARAFEIRPQKEFTLSPGDTFEFTPQLFDSASNTEFPFEILDLPPGLSYSEETGLISGTVVGAQYTGFTLVPTTPLYRERAAATIDLVAPPITTSPETLDILQGATTEFDLDALFDDPDIGSAVRYDTTEGSINIGLFDDTAPRTVSNYFAYSDAGAWNGTFFHRAIAGFVIQGGGFTPAEPGTATRIPTLPALENEFSPIRPNSRGTISMAKLGGNPDSATNQWFLSLGNNTTNLDNQNGGFTAFGKILGNGLTTANAIAALDTGTISVNGSNLVGVPLRAGTTSTSEPNSLVTVSSITRIPTLTYTTTTPGVSITGSAATITASGETTISLTATDLDGLATTVEIDLNEVASPTDLRTFAAKFQIPPDPEENSDGDTLPTLLEFATGSDPTLPDIDVIQFGSTGTSPTLTFPFEAGIPRLTAIVETSTDIASWNSAWNSNQGLDIEGNLLSTSPGPGSTTLLTISSGIPFTAQPRQFFRLRIIQN